MLALGYLAIIFACGAFGLARAAYIKKRPREIREMMNALALLDTEIYWGVTPLPDAFATIKQRIDSPWKEFFAMLEEKLKGGESVFAAWKTSISAVRKKACLDDEDWKIIEGIGKHLGRSDRNEEHKHLELGQKHLSVLYERIRNQADLKAKMWSYLGFLGGLAIAIFIM